MQAKRKIFLCLTARDIGPNREAVYDALLKLNRVDVEFMRDWVAQPSTSLEVCCDAVRRSDIFVGLVGHCFGSAPGETPGRSYTMLEWDWATGDRLDENSEPLPRLMHIKNEISDAERELMATESAHCQAAQRAFRELDLKGWHAGQADAWAQPDKLATHVVIAVAQQLAEMDAALQVGFSEPGY